MKKQDIINEVLMHSNEELAERHTIESLRDMYVALTADREERGPMELILLMRFFVDTTYLHKGIIHNLYAVHTDETDTFRAITRLNEIYHENMMYPEGVVEKSYEQLIPNGAATREADKIDEMIMFLRGHDAPAVYDEI